MATNKVSLAELRRGLVLIVLLVLNSGRRRLLPG